MGEIGVTADVVPGASTGKMARPPEVEPFLRGCAYAAGGGASYPRADPRDRDRLPADTWGTATIPVGVRLEFVGTAEAVEISYHTRTDDLGYRGQGAGTFFSSWRGAGLVAEEPARIGDGTVVLATGGSTPERCIVYLPEGMKPTVLSLTPHGGSIEPAPPQPRWLCYGDSIAEGWTASSPAGAWPAIAGRTWGFDVVNMGYAGAARGEIVSAEQIAALTDPTPAVISVSHGTNCWTRVPHSAGQMYEGTVAFLGIVRQGHPDVPIVVVSPVVRPDAEATPNRLGATLGDLRHAIERAVADLVARGDARLSLVPGADIIGPLQLADGIHPNDDGHRRLASVIGAAVTPAVSSAVSPAVSSAVSSAAS